MESKGWLLVFFFLFSAFGFGFLVFLLLVLRVRMMLVLFWLVVWVFVVVVVVFWFSFFSLLEKLFLFFQALTKVIKDLLGSTFNDSFWNSIQRIIIDTKHPKRQRVQLGRQIS